MDGLRWSFDTEHYLHIVKVLTMMVILYSKDCKLNAMVWAMTTL